MNNKFNLDKMYCGAIRRGDIFVVESKQKIKKVVIVLQEDILNQGLPTVVCALVKPYSKKRKVFPNEVLLKSNETGLGIDSLCLLYNIETIDRRMLIAKKGELTKKRLKQLFIALDINLGRFRDN